MKQTAKYIKLITILLTLHFSINCYSQQLEFMGLPLHSTISDYTKVLSSHRFKDEHTAGDLAHQYWRYGDFWKQKNCDVRLFAKDDIYVDIIEIRIPYSNFDSYDEYANVAIELLNDLRKKYGEPQIDTLNPEGSDIFFNHYDNRNDICYIVKWTLHNGELKLMINNDRVYTLLLQYKSIEYINWTKEASRFKGQGESDL